MRGVCVVALGLHPTATGLARQVIGKQSGEILSKLERAALIQ